MEENLARLGPSLLEDYQKVPAPRDPSGRRHPLPAILTLATCAMMSNCHSLYALAQWGREHEELAPKLGFTGPKTPAVSTLLEVFKRLDKEAFEATLRGWAQEELGDGEELPGVHLVAAYAQGVGLVLAQKGGSREGGRAECSSRGAGPA